MTRESIVKSYYFSSCYWMFIITLGFAFISRAYNEQLSVGIIIAYGLSANVADIFACSLLNNDDRKNKIFGKYLQIIIVHYIIDVLGLLVYIFTSNLLVLMISDALTTVLSVFESHCFMEAMASFASGPEYAKISRNKSMFWSIGRVIGSLIGIAISFLYIKDDKISKALVIICETAITVGAIPVEVLYYKTLMWIRKNCMKK